MHVIIDGVQVGEVHGGGLLCSCYICRLCVSGRHQASAVGGATDSLTSLLKYTPLLQPASSHPPSSSTARPRLRSLFLLTLIHPHQPPLSTESHRPALTCEPIAHHEAHLQGPQAG